MHHTTVVLFSLFSFILMKYECFDLQGWSYINLHCRNNQNKPVDWWFIYKPPIDDLVPMYHTGRSFSFISSETEDKWRPSFFHITANSMLQHTLSPLFRPTYADNLAAAVFNEYTGHDTFLESSTQAVLMADEMGGLLVLHTIPGFPNRNRSRPEFPEDQLQFGHLIACISLELSTLNDIAALLRATIPKVTNFQLPTKLESNLPDWKNINQPVDAQLTLSRTPLPPLEFLTKQKLLRAVMIGRRPNEENCLFKRFATQQHIILDVYGHDKRKLPYCDNNSGFRNIESISLKFREQRVHYINNATDRANFGVSTAAHWQKLVLKNPQYWTCTSTLESKDAGSNGGFILCFEDYRVWWNFDNLKVKEPEC